MNDESSAQRATGNQVTRARSDVSLVPTGWFSSLIRVYYMQLDERCVGERMYRLGVGVKKRTGRRGSV